MRTITFRRHSAHPRSTASHLRLLAFPAIFISLVASLAPELSLADIFRWDNGQIIPGTLGITPGPGIQLNQRDLLVAQLSNLDLTASNFSGSNLTLSRVASSTLTNANLSGANLNSADLSSSNFTSANLNQADLSFARLSFSTLATADLGQATITGAFLADTTSRGFTQAQLQSTASYQTRNLQHIRLPNNNLTGWNLNAQDLYSADITSTTLANANLAGANLTSANLNGSNLTGANLTGAFLAKASLNDTTSRGFTQAQLQSTASYQNKNLAGIRMSFNDLTGWDLSEQNLSTAQLNSSNLANADLSHANLTFTQLISSTLTGANLTGANLTSTVLSRANLASANFANAIVTRASLDQTTSSGFTKDQLYSTASYQAKDLRNIQLNYNDLSGWDFSGQNLNAASLNYSTRVNANFSGADLTRAFFAEGDLTGANFAGANLTSASIGGKLTNANFSGAIVVGAGFPGGTTFGLTQAQLQSTASYQAKTLPGIRLGSNNLSGWIFKGIDLTNAQLFFSNLANADFSGAAIVGAELSSTTDRGFTHAQLQSTASYQAKNLQGIALRYNNLTGWDLRGQNLSRASFSESTLTDVDFTGALVAGAIFNSTSYRGFTQAQLQSTASYQAKDLSGIDLSYNDLQGWNFAGVNLTGARFNSSGLGNVDFNQAIVADADFSRATSFTQAQLQSTASYKEKSLGAIKLEGNDLSAWDFSGQDLTNAILINAKLAGANLNGAKIRGARLNSTTSRGFTQAQLKSTASYQAKDLNRIYLSNNDLQGWDFSLQNLAIAVLENSNLSGANFAGANLLNAYFYQATYSHLDLSRADTRLARFLDLSRPSLLANTIRPDGTILGLNLASGETLVAFYDPEVNARFSDPFALPPVQVEIQFTIAPGATLDLNDNDLIVSYTGDSRLSTIQQYIQNGLANAPNTPHIASTHARQQVPPGDFPISLHVPVDNALIGATDWSGIPLAGTNQIIAKYTYFGDLNLDGVVDAQDYLVIDNHFGESTPSGPFAGDANLDGQVNAQDYLVIDNAFARGQNNPLAANAPAPLLQSASTFSPVPEPSTLALATCALTLAASSLIRRRCRAHSPHSPSAQTTD